MPRKAFVADLQEAISGPPVEGVSELQAGEEDGSFTFVYTPKSSTYAPVPIHALVTGEFPKRRLKGFRTFAHLWTLIQGESNIFPS